MVDVTVVMLVDVVDVDALGCEEETNWSLG